MKKTEEMNEYLDWYGILLTQKQQDIVFILNSIHNRHLKRKNALAAGKQELSDSSG